MGGNTLNMFFVLDAANKKEYSEWLRVWSAWPLREVFAHPEYVKLFARDCDRSICAVQESPDGLILLPMILRPLSVEAWAGADNPYYDLVSPYGFGGPYVMGRYDMEDFWSQFQRWAVELGAISAFFRFSPFAADIKDYIDAVEVSGGNVIRSLPEGKEGIWKDYKQLVRTHVKCAKQNGVTVEFDDTGATLETFIRLYYQTMQRCQATQQYYFPEGFFRKITTNLTGQFFLCQAMYQGEVIASYLVLVSQENIYYFLAGSDENFFKLRPNQYLTTEVFQWGIEHGKKCCVLGGGYEGYDGVFQYKKAFAPSGVVPFLVGKHIFNINEYQKLCEKRKSHQLATGESWVESETFFPAYRTKND